MNWTAEGEGWSSTLSDSAGATPPGGGRWSPAEGNRAFAAETPAQQMPAAMVIRAVAPTAAAALGVNATHTTWLYTFPRNLVGTVELQPLPAADSGARVTLLHGEWLETWDERGGSSGSTGRRCEGGPGGSGCTGPNVLPVVSGGLQAVTHVLRPNNSRPLAAIFGWHGFQYVRVEAELGSGFVGGLTALDALEIHPNVTSTGQLSFGGDGVAGSESEKAAAVLRGVQSMLLASQLSNLAAYIPMSCPTTEKQGWLGDALFVSEESMYAP